MASCLDLVLGSAPLASENISSGLFLSGEHGVSPKVKERFQVQEGWVWVPAPAPICHVILEDFLPHSGPVQWLDLTPSLGVFLGLPSLGDNSPKPEGGERTKP